MELSLFSFLTKRKSVSFAFIVMIISFFSCNREDLKTELLSGNDIISFKVSSEGIFYSVTISGTNINIVSPFNVTKLDNLLIEVLISEGANILPDPNDITLITNPIQLIVTAENGIKKTYTVTLSREHSPENNIKSVTIKNKTTNAELSADIDQNNNIISKVIPQTWRLTDIMVEMEISDFATIAPDPATINDYSSPINFVVTAEDGTKRNYIVEFSRPPFVENDFESFVIMLDPLDLAADIDKENGIVYQRVSPNTDLTQISIEYLLSEGATILPDPKVITDYSSPVSFVITSENNEDKFYKVVLEPMEEPVNVNCDEENASKWFGGDNRADRIDPDFYFAPRNVGTGQSFTFSEDIFISSYSIRFSNFFQFVDENGMVKIYFGNTTVRLQLRDATGNIVAFKDKTFYNPMQLFWQQFDLTDLNLVLKKDSLYYFTWYLVDGETLGINTGTHGNTEMHSGLCNGQGLSGTSTIREETSLDDWEIWNNHSWHFNFRLEGLR